MSRLTILSARPDLYSTSRLLEEASAAGFSAEVADYRRCSLGIGSSARVVYQGADLRPDVVIPRIGNRSTRYGAAVVRQLETMGCATVVRSGAILRARDKFAAIQAMAAAGVPVPATSAARSPQVYRRFWSS